MKFAKAGETITLEMSQDDYNLLLLGLGTLAGFAARDSDKKVMWMWLHFTNRLNETNPNFTPWQIPEGIK